MPNSEMKTPSDGVAVSARPVSPLVRARKILPWFVVVGAFYWLFRTTDYQTMLATFQSANWVLFWGGMFALSVVLFIADTLSVLWVYNRYHNPDITFREALPARGASYFIGIVNYAAGGAAMAMYFRRRFGVGVLEGMASIFLLMLLDLALVFVAAIVGGPFLPEKWHDPIVWLSFAFAAGAIGHLVFWRAPWSWGPLEKIRNLQMFHGFKRATLKDYAMLGAIRLPITALYIIMHALTLRAFHIPVPPLRLLVYVPIQMLVAAIPISVSGLGTVQLVQRELYAPYAEMGNIDAHGLAQFFGFNIPRFVIGLFFMRAFTRTMAAPLGAPNDSSASAGDQ